MYGQIWKEKSNRQISKLDKSLRAFKQHMNKILKSCIYIIFLISFKTSFAFTNSFSCPIGKQGACLEFNDKICSSFSKCVSNDAVCFDSFTCDFNGFVCKSRFDDLFDQYGSLVDTCQEIAQNHDQLVAYYNELQRKNNLLIASFQKQNYCISQVSSLKEAKNCAL